MNDSHTALRLLDEALEQLTEDGHESAEISLEQSNKLMLAAFRYWEWQHKLPPTEVQTRLPNYKAGSDRVRACTEASMAARKAVMYGNMEQAQEYTDYLIEKGYREPDFVRFCSKYELCIDYF